MLEQELRRRLREEGAALVGFADLGQVDEATRGGFPRAVSFCVALTPAVVTGIMAGPTEAYVAEYHHSNAQLGQMGERLAEFIRGQGWKALARPATGDWDLATLRAPFSHKMAATLSGLGWVGKCDLLVTPQYGPAVRWASVLTDAPLPPGEAIVASRCGTCRVCVDACPGQACSGREWRQGVAREEFWDPKACMAGMQKVSQKRLGRSSICGMCVAACPWTQAYLQRVGVQPAVT